MRADVITTVSLSVKTRRDKPDMPCCAAPAGISSRRSRAATSGTVLFFQPVPPTVPDWWQRKAPSTRFRWRSFGYSGRRTGGTALTFPLGARRRGRSSNTCTIIPPWMRWTSTRTTAANHRADSQADQPEPENRRHPVYNGGRPHHFFKGRHGAAAQQLHGQAAHF